MLTFSPTFVLPQFPGWDFRIRSRVPDWRGDVPARMAVIERSAEGGAWVDFMTIREPEEIEMLTRAGVS